MVVTEPNAVRLSDPGQVMAPAGVAGVLRVVVTGGALAGTGAADAETETTGVGVDVAPPAAITIASKTETAGAGVDAAPPAAITIASVVCGNVAG